MGLWMWSLLLSNYVHSKTITYSAQRQPTYNIGRFQNITNSIMTGYSKEMSLEKRHIQMSLRYFHKTISRLSNPAFNCINDYALTNSFKSKKISPPISIRATHCMRILELPFPYVMKDFAYSLANITQSSLSAITFSSEDRSITNALEKEFYSSVNI